MNKQNKQPVSSVGATKPVAILSLGLTPGERTALKVIAARERVTMLSIVRDLLAAEFPEYRTAMEDEGVEVPHGVT